MDSMLCWWERQREKRQLYESHSPLSFTFDPSRQFQPADIVLVWGAGQKERRCFQTAGGDHAPSLPDRGPAEESKAGMKTPLTEWPSWSINTLMPWLHCHFYCNIYLYSTLLRTRSWRSTWEPPRTPRGNSLRRLENSEPANRDIIIDSSISSFLLLE